MAQKAARNGCDAYFTIFESELRLIAALAAEWDDVETGGDMYGLLTHGGRITVFLALPPGPHATHEGAHFAQDINHFNRLSPILSKRFCIQSVGCHHSHHRLGIDGPSGGDVNQVQSITGKNGITHWADIIATHEDRRGNVAPIWSGSTPRSGRCSRSRFDEAPDIKINTFFYVNAPEGEKVRCPIRVIPGISPIRQAIIGNGILTDDELGFQGWQFPMEKILFDEATSIRPDAASGIAVPDELADQLLQLPADACNAATITPDEPFFIVSLPLTSHVEARIAFNNKTIRPIQAVYLSDDRRDQPQDITQRVFRTARCTSIAEIYAQLRRWLDNVERTVRGHPRGGTRQRNGVGPST